MGSGGGSSGGGSSGKVDYPKYMKDQHELWLDEFALIITNAEDEPQEHNPYYIFDVDGTVGKDKVFNPANLLAATQTAILDYKNLIQSTLGTANTTFSDNVIVAEQQGNIAFAGLTGEYDETRENLADLDPILDWGSYADAALAKADEIFSSTLIDAATVLYTEKQRVPFLREVGRYASALSEIGAANSSAYIIGLALMERKFQEGIDTFAIEKALRLDDQKKEYLLEGIRVMSEQQGRNLSLRQSSDEFLLTYRQTRATHDAAIRAELFQLLTYRIENIKLLTSLTADQNRIESLTWNEYTEKRLDMTVRENLWVIDMYQKGGNLLASIGGTAISTKEDKTNKGSGLGGAMSGALGGASAGAAAGSVIPGIRTALGAGIGLLMGGAGGFMM